MEHSSPPEDPGGGASRDGATSGEPQWTLTSDRAGGSKVCTVRLETAHVFHTGLGSAWSQDEVQAFLTDAVVEAGHLPAGAMRPPGTWPPEVAGWGEALRLGHEEIWAQVPGLGTTLVAELDGELWVLSRGAHHVAVRDPAGEGGAVSGVSADRGGLVWRLDAGRPWIVEVRLEPELAPTWTARWRQGAERSRAPRPAEPSWPAQSHAVRRPWPRWARRAVAGGGALVLLVALFALPIGVGRRALEVWQWGVEYLGARFRVRLTSYPAGAAILVDGAKTGRTTPAEIQLTRGRHRIELSLGPYGAAELVVEAGRAERLERHADLVGSLIVGTADGTLALQTRLDGRPLGPLPVRLDSVPAGRRHLSFQGRDVRPWTEEVDIVDGKITQVTAHPERVPETGVVVAKSYTVGSDGLTEVEGAAIYLDGRRAGWTPARLEVPRGYHTVRLTHGSEDSPVQLLRVEGGGELYATAEFGRSPEPRVRVEAPERISLAKPRPVVASLESGSPVRVRQMDLYWRSADGDYRRLPMELGSGLSRLTGSLVPPADSAILWKTSQFFVVVETDQGEEFVSEVRTVRIQP